MIAAAGGGTGPDGDPGVVFDPYELPAGPTNLVHWIDAHPDDNIAVTMLDERGEVASETTWAALRSASARLRGTLAVQGVTVDHRVAVLATNCPEFIVAYLAVTGLGAMTVPISPHSAREERHRQLGLVEPRAVVVGPGGALAAEDAASVALIVNLGGEVADTEVPVIDAADALAGEERGVVDVELDHPAVAIFTAGTADSARAAVLTHGNLLSNVAQILGATEGYASAADVVLDVLPWTHLFGLNAVLGTTLAAGARTVVLPYARGRAAIDAGRRHGISIITAVPTMVTDMIAAAHMVAAETAAAETGTAETAAKTGTAPSDPGVERADGWCGWPELRWMLSGAASLPAATAVEFKRIFGIDVHQGYGLTEAGPGVTTTVGQPARPGSVGLALPDVEVRLVDDDGSDAAGGDRGEIWVRGPNIFPGYWNDPAATASMLVDGWLRTGDLAVADDDGYLRIVDRRRDLIIVSGFNVHPGEVEAILLHHPDVADAVVVGEPDDRTGEAVTAMVVPHEGREVTVHSLAPAFHGKLARYKWPTRVRIVGSVPRGLGGKLLRRAFRHGI